MTLQHPVEHQLSVISASLRQRLLDHLADNEQVLWVEHPSTEGRLMEVRRMRQGFTVWSLLITALDFWAFNNPPAILSLFEQKIYPIFLIAIWLMLVMAPLAWGLSYQRFRRHNHLVIYAITNQRVLSLGVMPFWCGNALNSHLGEISAISVQPGIVPPVGDVAFNTDQWVRENAKRPLDERSDTSVPHRARMYCLADPEYVAELLRNLSNSRLEGQ